MPPRTPVTFPWALRQVKPAASTRPFTSTPSSLALGPESPNYIDVPKTVQPTYPPKPRIKGVLPVPRNVFKTRSALPKESKEFIEASTRDKQSEQPPPMHSRDADFQLYKRRLAEVRKTALREGVNELHQRKTRMDAQLANRVARSNEERRALAFAPPKESDVLTANSLSKGIRDFLDDKLPTTSRSNITEARRLAFQRKMTKHAAARQARLHDLYINAREFIVDEQGLDEALEKAFGTEQDPMGWNNDGKMVLGGHGESPWAGPLPDGVGDLLKNLRTGEGVSLANERVKKVAEELTGGKM